MEIIGKINLDELPQDEAYKLYIESLPEKIDGWLRDRKEDDYQKELYSLFDCYVALLENNQAIYSREGGYSIWSRDILEDTKNCIDCIKRALNHYLNGAMATSYYSISKWWNGERRKLGARTCIFGCYQIRKGYKYYRMRTGVNGKNPFLAFEMFHVPFQSRNKANTGRFSLPGFPALYMCRSIYTCWEELDRPSFDDFCVSKIEAEQSINLMDLRLWRNCKDETSAKEYLRLLPIIIACYIRKKDNLDTFKPEYIIPQMMLHSIIKEKDNRLYEGRYEGIVYNSTRFHKSLYQGKISMSENIIMPIKRSKEHGYCDTLCKEFKITDSIKSSNHSPMNLSSVTDDYFRQLELELDKLSLCKVNPRIKY
ncbi:hypothetical protein AB9N12_01625 [Bacteroides sp. AN502(2024)]|uniref:hypothetical protein n=1 Tax=Bacteroides sp. AN502(2024) TaxID=3160599 RepID=UPI003517E13A